MAVAVTARAYDYPYLTFQTAEGTLTSVSVESLGMTIAGGEITCTNAGGTQTFQLASLSKMYFSTADVSTGISSITADEPLKAEVFTIAGVSVGTFQSLGEATASLKPGVYVIKTDKETIKIAVR